MTNIKLIIFIIGLLPLLTVADGPSTIVALSDADLNQLLLELASAVGGSTLIPQSLLVSFGLYTPTVVYYLITLGYTII
jgi:hypothetical protein